MDGRSMIEPQTQMPVPRPPRPKMTAAEVKAAIHRRHGCGDLSLGQWVCIEEALSGFASAGGGIDVLALGVWRSAKAPGLPGAGSSVFNAVVAYEVKVSRADFRRELYGYQPAAPKPYDPEDSKTWYQRHRRSVPPWPLKAEPALLRSNYFMFATPAGLLDDAEIERRSPPEDGKGLWLPSQAGLIEINSRGCTVRAPAPHREAQPLTVHETAELIRYALGRGKAAA